ncbi:SusC/RagA family TonB-linked outer membrane protein [Pedobacter sp. Leaf250]|uniref:SusC/RagA family TonB-linked outer membrane protein n=1 Tax=Pedobacter sp. Leaf250 TaxID=2876559 RepID=UPI001E44401D|nr:SusC/RagA family TonB-linked outer membrane protein [Pedobacter sp. Leaf250]
MIKKYFNGLLLFSVSLLAIPFRGSTQDTVKVQLISKQDSSRMIEPGRFLKVNKINSTAAVSTVYGESLYATPTMNLTNTLYGRLNGLSVNQGSGEPGYDNASLGIRGIGSIATLSSSGYNTFKVFVDGFETNLNYFSYLSAAEIESVSILKDAAALATFGMRGANGVIYVTTKRGKIGKPTIQFQTRTGLQQAQNIYKPLDAFGYASLYNQAISNDRGRVWSPAYSAAQLQSYQNGTGTNVDWFDAVLKDHAPYTDADLTFNGGDDNARYNIVLDYARQQALYDVKQTDATSNAIVKRYNLRSNLDFKMFDIFEAKVDIGARLEDRKAPNFSGATLWQNLARYPSNIYPVVDPTGNYSGTTLYPDNPVASINSLGWFSSHRRILQGNFSLKERLDELVPGLYLSQSYSFNSYSQSNYSKTADYPRFFNGQPGGPTNVLVPLRATGMSPGGQEDWKQLMASVGYDKVFGKHQIQSAVNYHQSDFKNDGGVGAYIYHYQNISGRGNYVYDNRYVAEFGFSYFGADGYAPGNRWGFYPSLSASWIISNEGFLKNNKVLSFAKLRASVGKTSNMDSETQNSGRFLYQQYYNNSGTFYTGNASLTGNTGLIQNVLANPDIFAEQSIKYNLGAALTLISKINISADVFLDKRSGIISRDNTITGIYGTVNSFANLGEVTNKGFEVSLNFSDKKGEIGYGAWGQLAYNKNKIDYFAEIPQPYEYNQQTGRSIAQNYGLISTGFYQLTDFNGSGTLLSGQPVPAFGLVQPGDLKYQDLNGDNIIDEKDISSVGKSLFPEITYSFGANLSYKGFDLSTLFQGVGGSSVNILSAAPIQVQAFVGNGNVFPLAQGAWAYYPEQGIDTRATATYPRLTTAANNNNYRASSFWVRNRAFLRLRNVELGYAFNENFTKRISLKNLRLFINAVNPLTWSKLKDETGLDPETLSGYPGIKSYNAGLSVTF